LDLAKKTIPVFYYATDGTKAWAGTFNDMPGAKKRLNDREQLIKENPFTYEYKLTTHIWRNRESLFIYGFGPKADTITDSLHQNLIGLRVREGDFSEKANVARRQERILWIDPKRNDVPTEMIIRGEGFTPGRRVSLTIFHTRFLKYNQMQNGQWYPVHWVNEATQEDFDQKTKGGFSREFYLQIKPNMTLDPSWYSKRSAAMQLK
jgi:hypothetical protein